MKKKILTCLMAFGITMAMSGGLAYADEEEVVYEETELCCDNDGKNIYGVVRTPEGADEDTPTIIMAHGYGGNHDNCKMLQTALLKKGYRLYCFDFCGGGNQSQSDGETTEMSVLTEKDDLDCVLDTILSQDFVDADKLFLLGESQGGFVSAITANDREDDLTGLILLYPAFSICDDQGSAYASLEEIPDSVEVMGMELGRIYYEDIWEYNVYEHIADYTKDVLIIHGKDDNLVDPSYSEKAKEVYNNSKLIMIENAGHGFNGENSNLTADYIEQYINAELNGISLNNVFDDAETE